MTKEKKVVFIHSLFRTGSTYLWNKFRLNDSFYCFYEPLHPVMGKINLTNIEYMLTKDHRAVNHPSLNRYYLYEYKPLLKENLTGIPYFKKEFSYEQFFDRLSNKNSALKQYIDYLITASVDKIPVLKFNRTAFRVEWFKKNYPNSINIHITRHPRDLWQSYHMLYKRRKNKIFFLMDVLIASVNQKKQVLHPLSSIIPLISFSNPNQDYEDNFYRITLESYSDEEKYLISYYLWLYAFIINVLHADFIININLLSKDFSYKNKVNDFLRESLNKTINFKDAQIKEYIHYAISENKMDEIEKNVQDLLIQSFTKDQIHFFFKKLSPEDKHYFKFEEKNFIKEKITEHKLLSDNLLVKLDKREKIMIQLESKFSPMIKKYLRGEPMAKGMNTQLKSTKNDNEMGNNYLSEEEHVILEKMGETQRKDVLLVLKDDHLKLKDKIIVEKDRIISQKEKNLLRKTQSCLEKNEQLKFKDRIIADKNKALLRIDYNLSRKDLLLKKKDEALKQKDVIMVEKNQELLRKNEELSRKDLLLKEKNEEISGKELLLREKDEALEQKERKFLRKNFLCLEKNKQLRQKDKMIAEKDQEILRTDNELKEKLMMIAELSAQVKQKEKELKQKNLQLQNKNMDLSRVNRRIEQILNSRTYSIGKIIITPAVVLKKLILRQRNNVKKSPSINQTSVIIKNDVGIPDKKINLTKQLKANFGKHRSGLKYGLSYLNRLHNPKGVLFDMFIERTFCWNPDVIKPYQAPWIGFIHVPPQIPKWFCYHQSNEMIFKSDAWKKSLPYCKGLFTLSEYHRKYLKTRLKLPINSLLLPSEPPEDKWTWDKFMANQEKKIIQVGWWQRKLHAIYQFPEKGYKKVFLNIGHKNLPRLMKQEKEILLKEGTFDDSMYETVETLNFVSNDDYDKLLTENIIFIYLYDSSANNVIVECIVRNTPILVNPIEAVKEYLGKDYPLYFHSLEEAAEKAQNLDLIYKTHQYLINHPVRHKLTGENFLKSFVNSQIYRGL